MAWYDEVQIGEPIMIVAQFFGPTVSTCNTEVWFVELTIYWVISMWRIIPSLRTSQAGIQVQVRIPRRARCVHAPSKRDGKLRSLVLVSCST